MQLTCNTKLSKTTGTRGLHASHTPPGQPFQTTRPDRPQRNFWRRGRIRFSGKLAANSFQNSLCVTCTLRILVASRISVNSAAIFFFPRRFSILQSSTVARLAGNSVGDPPSQCTFMQRLSAPLTRALIAGRFHPWKVEMRGIEPLTSCLQSRRSTS